MSTLAQQRAAIAAGMRAARAGTGAAERQAIHDNMVAKRTGRNIQSDLNALQPSPRKQAGLRPLEPRGSRPATSSPAQSRPEPSNTPTGGIASPLTEKTKTVGTSQVADREYYATGLPSSDGLFILPAIKKMTFLDANGAEAVFDFATPGTLP